jgi:hypothetical protein
LGVFKKNRALCIDLIQSGPPSLLENLIQWIDHPAVLHGFLTIFNDTVSEAVDFLVWHFFVALMGKEDCVKHRPARRQFDEDFNYPELSEDHKKSLIELLSCYFRSPSRLQRS